jgi:hypothetical protein
MIPGLILLEALVITSLLYLVTRIRYEVDERYIRVIWFGFTVRKIALLSHRRGARSILLLERTLVQHHLEYPQLTRHAAPQNRPRAELRDHAQKPRGFPRGIERTS